MSQLPISIIVNVSVSQAPAGAGEYNTSNLGVFSDESPNLSTFGDRGYKIYYSPTEIGEDFGTESKTYQMGATVFSQKPNILAGGGYLVVILLNPSETLSAAVVRTVGLVEYFGLMATYVVGQSEMLAAAASVQALNKIAFFVQRTEASVEEGGALDLLRSGGFTQSRGLYYGANTDIDALLMQAAYAGRGLSVNFNGSNTTITMHLKDLVGIQPDPSMTSNIYNLCQDAGADIYASVQGVPKVLCSGENKFFDQVYNLLWFVGGIQIAGFNFLARTSTKVVQTEQGMDGLKGAYTKVCEQAVNNQYAAPGEWNDATTFGNQEDFFANIQQVGFYVYSSPIARQSQAARESRAAPLVQIALKEAGAIQSSQVIVYVNP